MKEKSIFLRFAEMFDEILSREFDDFDVEIHYHCNQLMVYINNKEKNIHPRHINFVSFDYSLYIEYDWEKLEKLKDEILREHAGILNLEKFRLENLNY